MNADEAEAAIEGTGSLRAFGAFGIGIVRIVLGPIVY